MNKNSVMKKKKLFLVMSLIATLIVTVSSAIVALEEVRLVTVISLTAGSFGAGASVVLLIYKLKKS